MTYRRKVSAFGTWRTAGRGSGDMSPVIGWPAAPSHNAEGTDHRFPSGHPWRTKMCVNIQFFKAEKRKLTRLPWKLILGLGVVLVILLLFSRVLNSVLLDGQLEWGLSWDKEVGLVKQLLSCRTWHQATLVLCEEKQIYFTWLSRKDLREQAFRYYFYASE